MFKEQDPGQSRFQKTVNSWTSFLDREHSLLEATRDKLARSTIYTWNLAGRHPRFVGVAGVVFVLGIGGIITHISDDTRWGIPPYRSLLALGAEKEEGNTNQDTVTAASSLKVPLESIYIPTPDTKEAIDTFNWNTFKGKGFTLEYPKEQGWSSVAGRIELTRPDGRVVVSMDAWAEPVRRGSFEAHVTEQYDNHTLIAGTQEGRLLAVTSQPANIPGWNRVGLRGEVLTYKSQPNAKKYDTRHFMAYINGMVYNVVVYEQTSERGKYNLIVDSVLNSLAIAGTGISSLTTK